MDDVKRTLLARLPDDVMHVEVRGLLRRRKTLVIDGGGSTDGGFVFAPMHELAVAFGAPGELAFERLAEAAADADVPLDRLELHGSEDVVQGWASDGIAEAGGLAHILRWKPGREPSRESRLEALVRHEARMLDPDDDALQTLPAHLRRELAGQEEFPVCAASFAGDAIASLVYAFVETETLWDVSIDTLADFRREGFATSSAAFLMLRQLERGLQPVWGASASNEASLRLAAGLGFEREGVIGTAVATPGENR